MNSNSHFKFAVTLISVLIFAFGCGQAGAFGTADDMDPSGLSASFKALDKNHSKKLSKTEVEGDRDVAKEFSVADKNRNGSLMNRNTRITNRKSSKKIPKLR